LSQDYLRNIANICQWPFLKNSPDLKPIKLKSIFLTEVSNTGAKAFTDQGVHQLYQKSESEGEVRENCLQQHSAKIFHYST
jgi:hypothetical protein